MPRRTPQQVILKLLADKGEMFGLDLVSKSDGQLGRSSIYIHLDKLQQASLVSSRPEEHMNRPGIPRRLYKITGAGKLWLEETK